MIRRWQVFAAVVVSCLVPGLGAAQDRPVTFLHGFKSDSGGWVQTADRLRTRVAIEVHTPNLNWPAPFRDQAADLRQRPEFAALPSSAVVVGHSNGGLVAREWSKDGRLSAVVTLGTPHRGAPILPHFGSWAAFNGDASWLASSAANAFGVWTDWSWTFGFVTEAIGWVLDFSTWSVASLGLTLGLDHVVPVVGDMHPYSGFLAALNSNDNLNRERTLMSERLGIVSVAHNFYWAGPARVVAPDQADEIAAGLYAAAYGLLYWGNYILSSADPFDIDAIQQAFSLIDLSAHLQTIDPFYCHMVSTMDFSACHPNDGLVPYTSQEYPGALNLYMGLDNDGPVHTRERESSEDVLYEALVRYVGLSPRLSSPPGGGAQDPPGSGGGSDPGTDPGTPGSGGASADGAGVLVAGSVLYPGDALHSGNGAYHLVYQTDSNLVLYDSGWSALWASNTVGFDPGFVAMQGDGNLVMYDAQNVPRWHTSTYDQPGAFFVLQDDGNGVVYDAAGRAIWATDTSR